VCRGGKGKRGWRLGGGFGKKRNLENDLSQEGGRGGKLEGAAVNRVIKSGRYLGTRSGGGAKGAGLKNIVVNMSVGKM